MSFVEARGEAGSLGVLPTKFQDSGSCRNTDLRALLGRSQAQLQADTEALSRVGAFQKWCFLQPPPTLNVAADH